MLQERVTRFLLSSLGNRQCRDGSSASSVSSGDPAVHPFRAEMRRPSPALSFALIGAYDSQRAEDYERQGREGATHLSQPSYQRGYFVSLCEPWFQRLLQ